MKILNIEAKKVILYSILIYALAYGTLFFAQQAANMNIVIANIIYYFHEAARTALAVVIVISLIEKIKNTKTEDNATILSGTKNPISLPTPLIYWINVVLILLLPLFSFITAQNPSPWLIWPTVILLALSIIASLFPKDDPPRPNMSGFGKFLLWIIYLTTAATIFSFLSIQNASGWSGIGWLFLTFLLCCALFIVSALANIVALFQNDRKTLTVIMFTFLFAIIGLMVTILILFIGNNLPF